MVLDRVAEEDDPLAQQARVDVVGAFPPAGGLDHHRHEHAWTPSGRFGGPGHTGSAAGLASWLVAGSAGSSALDSLAVRASGSRTIDGSVAPIAGGGSRRRGRGLGRLVVLEMRQRRVLGMGGQPAVDEPLDGPGPAEGAPDEAPPALGLEVADRPRVVGVALAGRRDLGLDVRVGDLDRPRPRRSSTGRGAS